MTVDASAPPRSSATPFTEIPSSEALVRTSKSLLVALALLNFVVFVVADSSSLVPGQLPSTWGTSGAVMTLTALIATLFARAPSKQLACHLGILAVAVSCVLTLSDLPVWRALLAAVAMWGVGFLATIVFACTMRGQSWSPTEGRHLVYLMGSIIVVVVPFVVLGILPGSGLSQHPMVNVWWSLRATSYAFLGAMLGFILGWFPQHWRRVSRHELSSAVLILLLSLACDSAFYASRDLQLSWLVLVPAVAAGMMLRPQLAAAFGVVSMMAAGLVPFFTGNPEVWYQVRFSTAGSTPFPVTILADLMFLASTFISLLLSIYRYQGRQLTQTLKVERVAAASEEALLDQIFESMTDGVVVLDSQLVPVLQNQASLAVVGGLPHEDIRPLLARRRFLDMEDKPLRTMGVRRALRGETVTTLVKLPQAEGAPRFFRLEASPIGDEEARSVLVIFADVTDDRLKEEELRSFAGVVAHDLRAPLTKVDGWLEILEESLDEENRQAATNALQQVMAGSRRMGAMIQDWLSVTVHREGELRLEVVDLQQLIGQVTSQLVTPEGVRPGLEVRAPDQVMVDPVLVRQVFANLCGNAMKYRSEAVTPQLVIASTLQPDTGEVQVTVRDNGIGIPPGEEARIFEEGHRASAHAQHFAGTGRGLALCARVVQRHGGRIWVRNNVDGPGATFFLTLPMAPPAGALS